MKSTRIVTVAAITLGAAVAFTGCTADAASTDTSTAVNVCNEVRDITNGALNTLAGDITTDQAATAGYLGELAARADALVGSVDDSAADKAFTEFSAELSAAADYVAAAPVPAADAAEDDAEADPQLTATVAAVQDAAAEAKANCSAQ